MRIRSLAEVGEYLRNLQPPPGTPSDPAAQLEYLEHISYQVLDSEFDDFMPGALEEYLNTFIYLKQLELGLIPFPDPREE